MEIATRPAIGTRVRVTYRGSVGYDDDTVDGVVEVHYPDGAFDVANSDGFVWTVFQSELANGRVTLEVTPVIVEHSSNLGRTWQAITPHDRSPLVAILAELAPYEIYDDGLGNLYRWRDDD